MTEQECLESIGQVTIFDVLEDKQENKFQVGTKIKIILPNEEQHSESHNYLKYYCSDVIGKTANILEVQGNSYKVYVNGQYLYLSEYEMELVE